MGGGNGSASLYAALLPAHLSAAAKSTEPARFNALVSRISADWETTGSVDGSLQWVAIVNSFVTSRGHFEAETLNLLANTMLKIVLGSLHDRFAQVRWCCVLTRLLRQYRSKLNITIAWRPLYEMMVRLYLISSSEYEGAALVAVHAASWCRLVRRARRFFPVEAAAEIWDEIKPSFENLAANACLEGMGFLCQLMPTKVLGESTDPSVAAMWRQWGYDWMNLWEAQPQCKYWTACMLGMFARMAKQDRQRVLDWEALMPRLITQCLMAIEIPVGGSLASSPIGRRPPRECLILFSQECIPRAKSAAKILIYLISPQGGTLPHLSTLADIFENYYHPSNGGQWTVALTTLLRHLIGHLVKRLASEAKPPPNGKPFPWGGPINPEQRAAIIRCLLLLIKRGHYSKNNTLSAAATMAMGTLSYVEPAVVLPMVVERFEEALLTVTATHQLVAALDALSICIRPLLLQPLTVDMPVDAMIAQALMATLPGIDANDPNKTLATLKLYTAVLSSVAQAGGAQDAREGDGALVAVFPEWLDHLLERLFTLFSNLDQPGHRGGGGDGHSATDPEVSFLMYGSSMYRPFMELLFARLPPPLYRHALQRIARFLQTTTLPGAVSEVGVLAAAIVWANPDQAMELLLVPLVKQVLSETQAAQRPATVQASSSGDSGTKIPLLSDGQEAVFKWWIGLLTAGLHYAGSSVVPHKALFMQALDSSFSLAEKMSSLVVGECASQLLSSCMVTLVCYYPKDQYKGVDVTEPGVEGGAVLPERWIAGSTEAAAKAVGGVEWHIPSSAEKAVAEELLEAYLEEPVRRLAALCRAQGAPAPGSAHPASDKPEAAEDAGAGYSAEQKKQTVRVLLLQLEGALGARSSLADFQRADEDDCPWMLIGEAGVRVGKPLARERVAEVVHSMVQLELCADPETLLLMMRVLDDLLSCGKREFSDWQQSLQAWRTDAHILTQPKVAGIFDRLPDDASMGSSDVELEDVQEEAVQEEGEDWDVKGCQKARPRWLVLERAFLTSLWRASQAVYFKGMPHRTPPPPESAFSALLGDVRELCMHRYKPVRQYAQTVMERCFKRFPGAVKPCLPPLLRALSAPTEDGAEEAALGACAALSGRSLSRYAIRSASALSEVMLTIMDTSHHSTVRGQGAVSELFMAVALRFATVVFSVEPDANETIAKTRSALMGMLSDDNGGSPMHWRYTLMANTLLLFLLRPWQLSAEEGALLARHALKNTCTELVSLRPLAISMLVTMLKQARSGSRRPPAREAGSWKPSVLPLEPPKKDAHAAEAVCAAVREQLTPETMKLLVDTLALNHSQTNGGANGYQSNQLGGDSVNRAVKMAMASARDWPRNKTSTGAVQSSSFAMAHARLFKQLGKLDLRAALGALRQPLEEACACKDRPHQIIAAEAFAGSLRAVDVPLADLPEWEEWMKPLLLRTILDVHNEHLGEWIVAIQYAVAAHSPAGAELRSALMSALAAPVPPGSPSILEAKRLVFLDAVIVEMASRPPEEEFSLNMLTELEKHFEHPSRQVREETARCSALLVGTLAQPNGRFPAEAPSISAPHLSDKLQAALTSFLEKLVKNAEDDATLIAKGKDVPGVEVAPTTLGGEVDSMQTAGGERFDLEASPSGQGADPESAEYKLAQARFETVLSFLVYLVKAQDAWWVLPTAVQLLGPLLRVQEVPDPDFSNNAKRTLAYIKYLPWPAALLPDVAGVLQTTARHPLWHTRAATINYIQVYAYRHFFTLDATVAKAIRDTVVALLEDPQLEVRQLAATTVAGLLRSAGEEFLASVRDNSITKAKAVQAETMRERKRMRTLRRNGTASNPPPTSTPSSMTLAQRHGPILGLAALVMSSPYDVPAWMPDVLICLAGASQEPPPIRDTVIKTVANWKKTHHDTWTQTRAAFTEEQWDAFNDLSVSPSYFV